MISVRLPPIFIDATPSSQPRDDAALADRKLERLVAVDRGVEFLALGAILIEPAGVMHDDGLARARRRAGAGLGVDDLQAGGCGDGLGGGLGVNAYRLRSWHR